MSTGMHSVQRVALMLVAGLIMVGSTAETLAAEPALRATIRYTSATDRFELISLDRLESVLPIMDELPEADDVSGFWYELLERGTGDVLYRRVIGNPVIVSFEGPISETVPAATRSNASRTAGAKPGGAVAVQQDAGGPPPTARGPVGPTLVPVRFIPEVRVFSVLIPDAEDGDILVLNSSPIVADEVAGIGKPVARFVLAVPAAGAR